MEARGKGFGEKADFREGPPFDFVRLNMKMKFAFNYFIVIID